MAWMYDYDWGQSNNVRQGEEKGDIQNTRFEVTQTTSYRPVWQHGKFRSYSKCECLERAMGSILTRRNIRSHVYFNMSSKDRIIKQQKQKQGKQADEYFRWCKMTWVDGGLNSDGG